MPTTGAEPTLILRFAALAAAALALGAGPGPAGVANAVGFVNENELEPRGERAERLALLRSWLEAGHDLGNNSYSHPDLQRVPLEESWLFRFRVAKGLPLRLELEPDPPKWVLDLYREAQR